MTWKHWSVLLFMAIAGLTVTLAAPPDCSTVALCSCSRSYDCYQTIPCAVAGTTGGFGIEFQTHLSGVDPLGQLVWPIVPNGEQTAAVRLPPGVAAEMVTQHAPLACGPPPYFSCPSGEVCAGGHCRQLTWQSPSDCLDRVYATRSSIYADDPDGTSIYFQDCDHFGAEMQIVGAVAAGDFQATGPIHEMTGSPNGIHFASGLTDGTITLRYPPICRSNGQDVCGTYVPIPDDSCFGRCGGTAPSGCSCATSCTVTGNCCPDVVNVCGPASKLCVIDPAGIDTDRMGKIATVQVGLVCGPGTCPTAPVTVQATVLDITQGAVKGASGTFAPTANLVFSTGDSTPKTLSIQGKDDLTTYGDRRFRVDLRAVSADPAFDGRSLPIEVTNVDRTDHAACIPQVENKFWAIPTHLTDTQKLPIRFQQPPFADYGFSECAGPPIPGYTTLPCAEHIEGIARLKSGPYLAMSGKGRDASHLMIQRLAAKVGVVGQWGSNFTTWDNDYMANGDAYIVSTQDNHAGGISIFGDFAAVPLEGDSNGTSVVFYDVKDPAHPARVGTPVQSQSEFAGAATVAKRNGHYLMAVMRNEPPEVQFYQSSGGDIRQPQTWTFLNRWLPAQDGFPVHCVGAFPQWAATIQNMTFVDQCDGKLFLAVTWNRGDTLTSCLFPWSENYIRLYEVDVATVAPGPTPVALRTVGERIVDCRSDDNLDYCNFAHAGNLFADPVTRDLILYGAWGYTEGLLTSIGGGQPQYRWFALAAEYSSQMSTPTGVTATQNLAGKVRIAWSPTAGAASYEILRDGVPVATASASPFDDTSVSSCARSRYSVRAVRANGQGSVPSAEAVGFTSAVPPSGTPFGPTLVAPAEGAYAGGNATLVWNPPCEAQTYRVEVATSPSFAVKYVVWSVNNHPLSSVKVPVTPGKVYYWRVRGSTALGIVGNWSATRSFQTQVGCGNGVCDGGDNCASCPEDCGSCPCTTVNLPHYLCIVCESTGQMVCGPGYQQFCCPDL